MTQLLNVTEVIDLGSGSNIGESEFDRRCLKHGLSTQGNFSSELDSKTLLIRRGLSFHFTL